MALSFFQTPTELAQAGQPLICTMYNSSYGSYTKYRYVLDITIGTTLVDRKKVLPNTAGYGVFDVSRTVQDFLINTYAQYTLLAAYTGDISNIAERSAVSGSTSFARNQGNSKYVKIEAREEYDIAGTVTLSSVQDTFEFYAFDSQVQYYSGLNYIDYSLYGNDEAVTKRFLTNAPIVHCPLDGYGTISFVNFYSGTLADNKIVEIGYIGYDDDGGVTGEDYYFNTLGISLTDAGITEGKATITNADASYIVVFLPFGWQNFEDDDNLSGIFDNSTQVKVKCFSENGTVMESPYLAITDCSRYPNVRLRFKNAFGVWDYFDFNKVSKKADVLTKKNYKKLLGTWTTSVFKMETWDRESTQYGFSGNQTLQVNSDYLSEEQYTWLAELVRSNDVYIYEDDVWKAVNVTETNYDYKTDVVDGIKKQLSLKLEYANDLRLNQ